MTAFFNTGIYVSIAVSLIAGVIIGSAMGIGGIGSKSLFLAEMLSFYVGGAIIVISQSILIVRTTGSLSLKAGALVCLLFILLDPVVCLFALVPATAVAYFLGRVASKGNRCR
jgi:hypothetical protein